MGNVRSKRRDPLPEHFSSLEEAGEFWDSHSSADYEEFMKDVDFDVELRRSAHEVRVAEVLLRELRKVARQKGLATETLVNLWLQEKLAGIHRGS
jgi:hypothetical protein